MRQRFPVLIVVAMTTFSISVRAQDKKEEPDSGQLKIDKVCSVGLPAKGYRWGEVREIPEVNATVCVCEKEGSPSRIILAIEKRTRKLDGERSGGIKGQYNGVLTKLKNSGFTIKGAKRPSIEPPIPDVLAFTLIGNDPKGKAI